MTQRMMMSERKETLHELQAARHAVELACTEAGIKVTDIDLAEVHDCFTINQMLCVEAMGLSEAGRAGHDFIGGKYDVDSSCPINLSGGLNLKVIRLVPPGHQCMHCVTNN